MVQNIPFPSGFFLNIHAFHHGGIKATQEPTLVG